MAVLKIGLSIFCILLSMCSFLLPEQSDFSFNVDYLDFFNSDRQSAIINLKTNTRLAYLACGVENSSEDLGSESDGYNSNNKRSSRYTPSVSGSFSSQSVMIKENCGQQEQQQQILEVSNLIIANDCETKLMANDLIKKINCENHCKKGKLNPLYEEDQSVVASSTIILGLNSTDTSTSNSSNDLNNKIINLSNVKLKPIQQGSTKF